MRNSAELESDLDVNRRYFQLLLSGSSDGFVAQFITGIICAAVFCSVVLALCGSVAELRNVMQPFEALGFAFCGVVFLAEWMVRCWVAHEDPALNESFVLLGRRGDYLFSFMGLIDFVLCIPFLLLLLGVIENRYLGFTIDWLGTVIVLSLFKLMRYVPGVELMAAVLRRERRVLFSVAVILAVLVVIFSVLLFMLEHPAQPEIFKSIPHTMWWGIVTMTTAGYGDMAPVTLPGRMVGGFAMLLAITMLAMLCGIIASGFSSEIKRRELLENWCTVSRMPLFARLDAGSISEIAGILKPQIIPAKSRLITKGGFADSMFFIIEGEVEVIVVPKPVRLGPGAFFGETGLLKRAQSNSEVHTVKQTRFLVLGFGDFHALVERQPAIGEHIATVAAERAQLRL
jgi:voltage-gated potassium channel